MNAPVIGEVVQVSSSQIRVLLSLDSMEIDHEGRIHRVGQLGTYLTFPQGERTIVGFVIGTDRQGGAGADQRGGVVVSAQLLGEIANGRFARGVNAYPIVGDEARIAVREDFETIFGSLSDTANDESNPESFPLGRFALSTDFEVRALGSEFFAKHVAVVGNSGSGKSCTTAKILQEVSELGQSQVVLFDLHGEYRAAFSDEDGQLNANVAYLGVDDLVMPYWLLEYDEFERMFVDRSNPLHVNTQISFLRTALLEFKQDAAEELGLTHSLTLDTPIYFSLEKLKTYAENLNEARYVLNDEHLAFSQLALRSLPPAEQQKLMREQRCSFNRGNPEGETPHPLYFGALLGLIDQIDTKYQDRRFEFLMRPIEHGMKSRFFREVIEKQESAGQASGLMNHLIKLLIGRVEPRTNLTIIDLSGIPFEVVDITVAVFTRLLFDLNFWTPPTERHPMLIAFEEAHNYIPRIEREFSFAKRAVERVAKEGRKYGVSAMVISQRPSELSETVLAQCNTLVVMRLSNPEDQHYVSKVVSDHFSSLIDMLPILRPGEAFIIGDSVVMPMRTLIDLPDHLPQSGDVDFFKFWSSREPCNDPDEVIEYWRRQQRRGADNPADGSSKISAPPGDADSSKLDAPIPPPKAATQPTTPFLPGGLPAMPRGRPG